jgi:lysozyme
MKINKAGIALIKQFESLHDGDLTVIGLQPKLCPANVWTVGWGHAIVDPVTRQHVKGKENRRRALELFPALSEAEAELLLQRDLLAFSASVRGLVTKPLNENQFSALVSFCYNLGAGRLRQSTLLRKLNTNPGDPSIRTEFLKWVSPGTSFERGLRRRRAAEADLYFTA